MSVGRNHPGTKRLLKKLPLEIDKIRASLIPEEYRETYINSASVSDQPASYGDHSSDPVNTNPGEGNLFVDTSRYTPIRRALGCD